MFVRSIVISLCVYVFISQCLSFVIYLGLFIFVFMDLIMYSVHDVFRYVFIVVHVFVRSLFRYLFL